MVFVFCILSAGGLQVAVAQNQATAPKPEAVIDQIKQAVVFLQGSYTRIQTASVNGVPQQVPVGSALSGTGFLIFEPEARLGPDQGIIYLVTTKHLIREPGPKGELGEGPYFKGISVRTNRKTPSPDGTQFTSDSFPVVDDSGSLVWFIDPDDDTVDLAIAPIRLSPQAEFKTIPTPLFATRELLEQKGVNENDEILFAGLFAWYPGAKKNYPIVRHGKLALLSQERIPLDSRHPDKTVEVYLADVMSFGGNSGSPVFLRIGGIREALPSATLIGYSYYLLGVMKGFFPEAMPFELDGAQLYGQSAQNSGIAAVVPADKILHILGSPRVQAYSERVVAGSYTQNGNLGAAEKCYEKAISILESSVPEHSDLASALFDYALLLRKMDRTAEAGQAEERAKKIMINVQTDRMHPRS
jgi:hypothetical protein